MAALLFSLMEWTFRTNHSYLQKAHSFSKQVYFPVFPCGSEHFFWNEDCLLLGLKVVIISC